MKYTATGLAIHFKERMHIVDTGASLNRREKKTVRQSSNILDIQTANGIVVLDTQAKVYIKELGSYPWIHLVKDSPSVLSRWEDHAINLVILIRGRQEKR